MRAVVMRDFGGPEVLASAEVPVPTPAPGEALVRVEAVEVSRTRDVATRAGSHPFSRQVSLPQTLGGDFAGVVERVADPADERWVGVRVAVSSGSGCGHCEACDRGAQQECPDFTMIGIHRDGSYAELAVAPVANLTALPDDLGAAEAAAFAAAGPIAFMQLRESGLRPGDSLLVPGASGAVASILLGLAARRGINAFGLSRGATSAHLAELGVPVLDTGRADLTAVVRALAGGAGLDCAIDNVSAPSVVERYLPALRRGGRILVSGAINGDEPPVLRISAPLLYVNSLSIVGIRSPDQKAIDGFWRAVHDGFRLPSSLVTTMPLERAAEAHALIEQGRTSGHTVLAVHGDARSTPLSDKGAA